MLDQVEEYFLYHGARRAGCSPSCRARDAAGTAGQRRARRPRRRARASSTCSRRASRALRELPPPRPARPRGGARSDPGAARPLQRARGRDERSIEPALVDAVLDEVAAGRIDPGIAGPRAVAEQVERERPHRGAVPAARDAAALGRRARARLGPCCGVATLAELGGAQRIVEDHLEHAMAGADAEQRDVAAGMFDHLVTPSGTKIAHAVADLASFAHVDRTRARAGAARARAERILRRDRRRGRATATRSSTTCSRGGARVAGAARSEPSARARARGIVAPAATARKSSPAPPAAFALAGTIGPRPVGALGSGAEAREKALRRGRRRRSPQRRREPRRRTRSCERGHAIPSSGPRSLSRTPPDVGGLQGRRRTCSGATLRESARAHGRDTSDSPGQRPRRTARWARSPPSSSRRRRAARRRERSRPRRRRAAARPGARTLAVAGSTRSPLRGRNADRRARLPRRRARSQPSRRAPDDTRYATAGARVPHRFVVAGQRGASCLSAADGQSRCAAARSPGDACTAPRSARTVVIATAGADGDASCGTTTAAACMFDGHPPGLAYDVGFTHLSRRLVVASSDGAARVWAPSGHREAVLSRHGNQVRRARFGKNQDGAHGQPLTARTDDGRWTRARRGPSLRGTTVRSRPPSSFLATGSRPAARTGPCARGSPSCSHPAAGRPVPPPEPWSRSAREAIDGKVLRLDNGVTLRGHRDGARVRVLARRTARRHGEQGRRRAHLGRPHGRAVLSGHGAVYDASFSPDGRWVVTGGPATAGLWHAATAELWYFLRGDGTPVHAAAFDSPRRIVTSATTASAPTSATSAAAAVSVALAEERLTGHGPRAHAARASPTSAA